MANHTRVFSLGLVVALLACCNFGYAQGDNEPNDWLLKFLGAGHPWHNSNHFRKNDQSGGCPKSDVREPQSIEEIRVTQQGYYLMKSIKTIKAGDFTMVVAGAEAVRACEDVTQAFIFLDGNFISELAPDYMVREADGGFIEARALGNRDFEVDFADFDLTTSTCQPTAHSACGYVTIKFHVREMNDTRTTSRKFVVKPVSYSIKHF